MDDYNDRIISGIKRVMKERKRSIKSMSESTGLPYRSLQNYLSGSSRLPADVYVKILEVLDVDNQYIMEGTFHLKYWPLWDSLWASLGDSLVNTEYKPDTGFPDDMEFHNRKQLAAAKLLERINDNYNKFMISDTRTSHIRNPSAPEMVDLQWRRWGRDKGPQ